MGWGDRERKAIMAEEWREGRTDYDIQWAVVKSTWRVGVAWRAVVAQVWLLHTQNVGTGWIRLVKSKEFLCLQCNNCRLHDAFWVYNSHYRLNIRISDPWLLVPSTNLKKKQLQLHTFASSWLSVTPGQPWHDGFFCKISSVLLTLVRTRSELGFWDVWCRHLLQEILHHIDHPKSIAFRAHCAMYCQLGERRDEMYGNGPSASSVTPFSRPAEISICALFPQILLYFCSLSNLRNPMASNSAQYQPEAP